MNYSRTGAQKAAQSYCFFLTYASKYVFLCKIAESLFPQSVAGEIYWDIQVFMTIWSVRYDRITILHKVTPNRLFQRASHLWIVWAIRKLTDDDAVDTCKHTTHAQIIQHAINMILLLPNILQQQCGWRRAAVNHVVERVRRALQTIQHTQVATYHVRFCNYPFR